MKSADAKVTIVSGGARHTGRAASGKIGVCYFSIPGQDEGTVEETNSLPGTVSYPCAGSNTNTKLFRSQI